MKHFQVLIVALLTAITFELGWMAIKLPTPEAHAQVPSRIPTPPAIEDPHEALKRQITEVQRELAGDRQRLAAIEQQVARVQQNEERVLSRVNDDSKRLLTTCVIAWIVPNLVGVPSSRAPSEEAYVTGAKKRCTAQGWNATATTILNNFDVSFGQ